MCGEGTKVVKYIQYWANISLNKVFLHLFLSKEQIHSRNKEVSQCISLSTWEKHSTTTLTSFTYRFPPSIISNTRNPILVFLFT